MSVCGPTALAKSVTSTLREPRFFDILRGAPSVSLYVESFGHVSRLSFTLILSTNILDSEEDDFILNDVA
jgi:hypothetical protein